MSRTRGLFDLNTLRSKNLIDEELERKRREEEALRSPNYTRAAAPRVSSGPAPSLSIYDQIRTMAGVQPGTTPSFKPSVAQAAGYPAQEMPKPKSQAPASIASDTDGLIKQYYEHFGIPDQPTTYVQQKLSQLPEGWAKKLFYADPETLKANIAADPEKYRQELVEDIKRRSIIPASPAQKAGAFVERFSQSGADAITGTKLRRTPLSTGNEYADKTADVLGFLTAFMVPSSVGTPTAPGMAFETGGFASQIAPKVSRLLGNRVPGKLLEQGIKRSVGFGLLEAVDSEDPKQIAKAGAAGFASGAAQYYAPGQVQKLMKTLGKSNTTAERILGSMHSTGTTFGSMSFAKGILEGKPAGEVALDTAISYGTGAFIGAISGAYSEAKFSIDKKNYQTKDLLRRLLEFEKTTRPLSWQKGEQRVGYSRVYDQSGQLVPGVYVDQASGNVTMVEVNYKGKAYPLYKLADRSIWQKLISADFAKLPRGLTDPQLFQSAPTPAGQPQIAGQPPQSPMTLPPARPYDIQLGQDGNHRTFDGKQVAPKAISSLNKMSAAFQQMVASERGSIGYPPDKDFTPAVTGKADTTYTERNEPIEVKYAVVDLKDLVASHDSTFKLNPRFPQELQPRMRERQASEDQVTDIINKFNPSRLGANPEAGHGAPMIGKDGVVEIGNARTIALSRIYEQNLPQAEAYKKWVTEQAETYGLDRAQIEKVQQPVLVRVRETEVADRAEFARTGNVGTAARMSAMEVATLDAQKLTPELLASFIPNEHGKIDTGENRKFVASFIEQVVPRSERGTVIDSTGHQITKDGLGRIRNAIFSRVYEESTALEKLSEDTDVNVKNQINAMVNASPSLLEMKVGIEKGELYPLDITKDIAQAMIKLSDLRETKMTVDEYLRQQQLFGEDLSPIGKDILVVFDKHKRSGSKLTKILNDYAKAVELLGDPQQISMVERDPKVADVFRAVIERVESLDEGQLTLFADRPEERGLREEVTGRGRTEEPVEAGTEVGAVSREGVTKSVKEPWEMTREEFNSHIKDTQKAKVEAWNKEDNKGFPPGTGISISDKIKMAERAGYELPRQAKEVEQAPYHKLVVEAALKEGKPVPPEVLKDYPDLHYRRSHKAPLSDENAPLHEMNKLYPDDIYGPNAAQYYGHFGGNNPLDVQASKIIQGYRGQPDKPVTIYRAVPKEAGDIINPGDWVTITKEYAKVHGESTLEGDYKVISKTVPARDLFTEANSIHEFGYDPQPIETKPVIPTPAPVVEKPTTPPRLAQEGVVEKGEVKPEPVTSKPETKPAPTRELLSDKGNTGEVYREGDWVYKQKTNRAGEPTQELEILKELQGAEGIPAVKDAGDRIAIPYYEKIISIDTIPKGERHQYADLVRKNEPRINRIIDELNKRNITYQDQLQFGVDKNDDFYLVDFSLAVKREVPKDMPKGDIVESNRSLVSAFINTFVPRAEKPETKPAETPTKPEVKPAEPAKTEKKEASGNIGYHAGDLGKAEYLNSQFGSRRHTGHFGTGTYFVGDKAKLGVGSYPNRPIRVVDVTGYKLWTPLTEREGITVHDYHKEINRGTFEYSKRERITNSEVDDVKYGEPSEAVAILKKHNLWNDQDFKEATGITVKEFEDSDGENYKANEYFKKKSYEIEGLRETIEDAKSLVDIKTSSVAHALGTTEDKLLQVIEEVNKEVGEITKVGFYKLPAGEDSASTRIMKRLGYEGVDVREYPGLDNTTYGSVIYDLKQTKEPATPKPEPAKPVAQEKPVAVKPGAEWSGDAYRVESGYEHGRKDTALDVVKFETKELGNQHIGEQAVKSGIDLDKYRASDTVWVTAKDADAKTYYEGNIEKVELPTGSKVIASDGQGGYLVLRGDAKPIATEKPVEPVKKPVQVEKPVETKKPVEKPPTPIAKDKPVTPEKVMMEVAKKGGISDQSKIVPEALQSKQGLPFKEMAQQIGLTEKQLAAAIAGEAVDAVEALEVTKPVSKKQKYPHLTDKQSAEIEKLESQYNTKRSKAKNQRALQELLKSKDKIGTMLEYMKSAEGISPPLGTIEVLEKIQRENPPLSQLSYEELKGLYKGALHYVHRKLTEDKLIQGDKWHSLQEATDRIVQGAKRRKKRPFDDDMNFFIAKLKQGMGYLVVEQMLPEYIAHFIQGTNLTAEDIVMGKDLPEAYNYFVAALNQGYDKKFTVMQDLQSEWLKEFEKDKAMLKDSLALSKSSKDITWHQFKLESGKTIELAPDQIMEVYMHAHNEADLNLLIGRSYSVWKEGAKGASKHFGTREAAEQYIAENKITATIKEGEGGIRVPFHNTPYAKRSRQDKTKSYALTADDLRDMFDRLTPGQKRRAQLMLKHYNNPLKEYLNEASLAVHGYEIFDVDKYGGPRRRTEYDHAGKKAKAIEGSMSDLYQAFEDASYDALGIAQPRTKETGSLYIAGAYQKYLRYVMQATDYGAFLEPYYNAKQILENRGFKLQLDSRGLNRHRLAMEQLMKDVAMFQRISLDEFDRWVGDFSGKFQTAALGLSVWVPPKQVVSYVLAATEIPMKYLTKGLATLSSAKDVEEIAKYSPRNGYMRLKRGASSREMGEIGNIGMPLWFYTGRDTFGQKLTSMIKRGDSAAVIRIWKDLKGYVKDLRPDLEYNSEEFLQTVGKVYDWLVDRTQPTHLPTSRGAITRSRNPLLRLSTFFMTQRNKNANGMTYAWVEFANSERTPKDLSKALKKVFLFAFASSVMLLGIDEIRAKVKMKGWDRSWDKQLMDVVGLILGNFFPINHFYAGYLGKKRYGVFGKFYDIDNPIYESVNAIIDFAVTGTEAIEQMISQEVYKTGVLEGQKKWSRTLFRAVEYGLDGLAPLTGWPLRNIRTNLKDAGRWVSPDMQFLIDSLGRAPNVTTYYKTYWGFLEKGDTKMAERYMTIMIDHLGREKSFFEKSFKSYDLPPELLGEMSDMYDRLSQ